MTRNAAAGLPVQKSNPNPLKSYCSKQVASWNVHGPANCPAHSPSSFRALCSDGPFPGGRGGCAITLFETSLPLLSLAESPIPLHSTALLATWCTIYFTCWLEYHLPPPTKLQAPVGRDFCLSCLLLYPSTSSWAPHRLGTSTRQNFKCYIFTRIQAANL